jgi:hypothetical protein
MNDIISLIGTIASIGSIPFGFYFFIKGKEEKRAKVKRDISKAVENHFSTAAWGKVNCRWVGA